MTITKDMKLGALLAALSLTVACAPATTPNTSFGDAGSDDEDEEESEDSSDKDDEEEDESESSSEDEEPEDDDAADDTTSSGSTTSGGGTTTSGDGTTSTSSTTAVDPATTMVDPTNATGGEPDPTSTESDTTGTVELEIDPANMIDDVEDGDTAVIGEGGRNGYWYTFGDDFGTQTAAEDLALPGGPNESGYKIVSVGSGFSEWGASVAVNLDEAMTLYDVSGFTGVTFFARGTPGSVSFKVTTAATVPVKDGGTCEVDCDNAYAADIALTSAWTQYVIPFSELAQGVGWGTEVDWDPATAIALQWQTPTTTAEGTFEIHLDNVAFY